MCLWAVSLHDLSLVNGVYPKAVESHLKDVLLPNFLGDLFKVQEEVVKLEERAFSQVGISYFRVNDGVHDYLTRFFVVYFVYVSLIFNAQRELLRNLGALMESQYVSVRFDVNDVPFASEVDFNATYPYHFPLLQVPEFGLGYGHEPHPVKHELEDYLTLERRL